MSGSNHGSLRRARRNGSVLIPTLYVIVVIVMLLSAILPLMVTRYGLARADRDRSAALTMAEAGLSWEIARINDHLWGKDDSGSTAGVDSWPTESSAPPATASVKTLLTDASGQWQQRFLVGTEKDPFSVGGGGSFKIIAEGQVRAPDGHIVKRRVKIGGASLMSLFDTMAIFAFSTGGSAWTLGGSTSIVGGCGSNGQIYGNGGPSIAGGPILLWGPNASITGVDTGGVTPVRRPGLFVTNTADEAANLLRSRTLSGAGVAGWAPTGYDADGAAIGPIDNYGDKVNSEAEIATSAGVLVRTIKAGEFLDKKGYPVLDGSLWSGSGYKLRLKPGVYYFARINLNNNDVVEIANDYYEAGTRIALYDANHNPINGPPTATDYDSDANRVTIFVDAVTVSGNNPYLDSNIGSGLYTALQGYQSDQNPLRYRRPGNFRVYARNRGGFSVSGSSNSPVEFNCNLLHYNGAPGSCYGSINLNSSCHLYGGLFGWTVDLSGGAVVEQYGSGIFTGNDPVTVAPLGASGGGIGGGFGAWQWQELPFR